MQFPVMAPERDPWSDARSLLRTAPRRVRRVLWFNTAAATGGIAIAVIDLVTGTSEQEIYRLLGVGCAMIGLVLMTQVYVLHHLSQHPDPDCRISTFQLRSTRPHGVFRTLALLGVLAALLLVLALGLFLPSAVHRPWLFGIVAFLLFYIVVALRTVNHITGFLYEYSRAQAEAVARAEAAVTDARLRLLQAQMQPHFLFNALNTVAALVRTDARQAERTVENLAQVLRRGLERSRRPMGTVREEIDFIRAWLAVEQQRWGDRLRVAWHVDDAVLELPLPPMTLQPLVENALKHGLGARIAGGHITIGAERSDGRLHLSVTDDGGGVLPGARDGTGLGNLRQRLQARFGDAAQVYLTSSSSGTVVDMHVPVDQED